MSPRIPFFIVVGLVAMAFFGTFVNRYVLQSSAAQSKVVVEFSPVPGTLGDTPFRIVLKPENTTDKLSGADVTLTVQNGTISSWLPCKPLEEGKNPQIKPLIETIGATPRYSCVILDKDENLVSGLVISGNVQCSGTSPVIISIDTQKSQVSGPVEGALYAFSPTQTVTYNCAAGITPTPVPSDVSAEFDPTTCRGDRGSSCSYGLTIKSNDSTKKISAYYVKVNFDKSILKGKAVAGPASVKGLLAQVVVTATPTPASSINVPTAVPAGPTAVPTVAPTAVPGAPTTVPASRSCTTDKECVDKFCGGSTIPNCSQVMFCDIPAGQTTGSCNIRPGTTPGVVLPTGGVTPTGSLTTTPPVGGNPVPVPPKEATCSMVNTDVDNEKGTMTMLYVCDSASADLKTSLTNTLTFDAAADGEGALTIADIQVVGPQAVAGLYSVNKGSAKYVIGQGGGNVDVKLKLRMQGIVKKPSKRDSMQVRIGVGDGGLAEPVYKNVEFKSDANGHFIGDASFNVPARKDYKLLIKCEHCLQRKVCDKDAKETEAASYSCDKGKIELKNGANSFDLSGIVQLACDIPAGKQDGVCNSADFALVRNLLGKSDDDAIRKADLNFDGIVNAIDFSIMTASRINVADIK